MKTNRLYDAQDHVTEEGAKNGTRLVAPGTILIVVRGMILADEFPVAMAMRDLAFNQDLKALDCSPEVYTPFLFYWLQGNSHEILGIVDEAAHGTKRLQTDRLLNLPLLLPPLPTQRRIAGILSAYDDLIENNEQRIAILEEMARNLYREWFVDFRFPGHEDVAMRETEIGMVPEGWEVVKLGIIAKINELSIRRGQEPAEIYYVDISSVTPGRVEKVEKMAFTDAPGRARRIVRHGDTIWSMVRPNRRSYSLILDPYANLIVSTGFAVLTPHAVPYTYLLLQREVDDLPH